MSRTLRTAAVLVLATGTVGARPAVPSCPDCGTIAGVVLDASGATVAGAQVMLEPVPRVQDSTIVADSVVRDGGVTRFWSLQGGAARFLGAVTQTSASGDFWVDALPAGIYALRATHLAEASEWEAVPVRAEITHRHVVRMRAVRARLER